ncbi:EKC/KEOPS complex subunit Gon7p [[Candida] jaroonii]|uniref:EKC/KEOPS complex subunit Gon7p n=1 Tax=[Candida] jaroonii TaxID=467808 RepID=A0ACA9Y847_9ASCO|nr:EKC/KEOPS complex subunit Gon7p [[Candida] jaroonii]
MNSPIAEYSSPDINKTLTAGDGPHSTNGKTTQISEFVTKAGGEDRDKPTEASDSQLGQLRAKITSLQDNINVFLTQRMKQVKDEGDIERRILDDGVDEDSD